MKIKTVAAVLSAAVSGAVNSAVTKINELNAEKGINKTEAIEVYGDILMTAMSAPLDRRMVTMMNAENQRVSIISAVPEVYKDEVDRITRSMLDDALEQAKDGATDNDKMDFVGSVKDVMTTSVWLDKELKALWNANTGQGRVGYMTTLAFRNIANMKQLESDLKINIH